jgi:hypothetical protein
MFVMRSKAKLRDATEEEAVAAVIGVGGAKGEAALRAQDGELPPRRTRKVQGERGTVIRLGDAFGAPRYLWLTSAQAARPPCRAARNSWRWAATPPGSWRPSTPACRK